jgi:hypothetical protein
VHACRVPRASSYFLWCTQSLLTFSAGAPPPELRRRELRFFLLLPRATWVPQGSRVFPHLAEDRAGARRQGRAVLKA